MQCLKCGAELVERKHKNGNRKCTLFLHPQDKCCIIAVEHYYEKNRKGISFGNRSFTEKVLVDPILARNVK